MKQFMGDDFLLNSKTANHLYHDYAKQMPIIDYHCHLSPKEIYEDVHFQTITEAWLKGDHYKWRIMRAHGVEERYITGDASDEEKFMKWAETISLAIGNPLFHWTHLELQQFFDYHGVLNNESAKEVYELCNKKLKTLSARKMIEMSNVTHLCTTDDPIDDLCWHKLIKEDKSFKVKVMPAFRPDKSMSINRNDYLDYIAKLSKVSEININSFASLMEALKKRIEFFNENGCSISDHGMDLIVYKEASEEEIETIFHKRLNNQDLSQDEIYKFRTAFLLKMCKEYAKNNWVVQLHYGVVRDNNEKLFKKLGPDAGIDSIGDNAQISMLAKFLNALAKTDELPKTIVYSLNPIDNTAIETVIACFQEGPTVSKLQHGAAWWFNDHKDGMEAHMKSLANEGMLAHFVGMLTDSRSFLSYARHDYFRRILCNLVGEWIENGEYPNDELYLEKIIKGISYNNAYTYFNFDVEEKQ